MLRILKQFETNCKRYSNCQTVPVEGRFWGVETIMTRMCWYTTTSSTPVRRTMNVTVSLSKFHHKILAQRKSLRKWFSLALMMSRERFDQNFDEVSKPHTKIRCILVLVYPAKFANNKIFRLSWTITINLELPKDNFQIAANRVVKMLYMQSAIIEKMPNNLEH